MFAKPNRLLVTAFLLLGLVAVPRSASAELPEVVKRYVDEVTLVVGRMDVAELRSEAVVDFINDLLKEAPRRERDEILEGARQGLAGLEEILAPLRERGVTTAWFIMGPSNFMQGEPALMIVPVADNEQAKLVTDLLIRRGEDHRRVDGAVLIGTRQGIASAEQTVPAERPVLERAFARTRGGPALQIVFEPTPLVRIAADLGLRQLAGQSPQFPREIIDLFPSLESINYALALPPRPRSLLSMDFVDEEAAEQAREFLHGQVQQLEARFQRIGIDQQQARELIEAFLPEADEKRVHLELTPQELRETVGPVMVVSMLQSREGALRVRTGRNLRLLAQAIILWSYEHGDGRLPQELSVVEQVFTDPKVDGTTWRHVRRNPRYNVEDAFAYVRPADRLDLIREPEITVIAYEKPPADGIRDGVNVAFADGSVEWLSAEDFEELAQAQGFEIQRLPRR